MQCSHFRSSQLVNGNNNIGMTKYISHSNSSIQVRVLAQNDGGLAGVRGDSDQNGNLSGVGLYRASGPRVLAFSRAMNQCMRGSSAVAHFDCLGGRDGANDEE